MEPGVAYSPTPPAAPVASSKPTYQAEKPSFQPPLKLIGTIAIVAVLILASIFALKQTKKTNPVAFITPTPSVYRRPVATPKLTNSNPDWKEYVDPANVFSVKYPPEYNLSKYDESSFTGLQLQFAKPATSASASAQIIVKIIYLQNSAKTAKQFVSEQMALEKNSTLDGLTINLKGEWGRGKIIFMEQGGTVYRLSSIISAPLNLVPGYEDTINKIFASFTILNPDDRGK